MHQFHDALVSFAERRVIRMKDHKNGFTGDQGDIPFMEKFMVPQMYELFRFGGSSVKNEESGIRRMLQYFSDFFTEEQLRQNMEHYNLQKMFDVVKEYFYKEYGYEAHAITLSNRYQKTINSYIYNDKDNPVFVHIDELFESTVMAFFLVMFKWSKNFSELETYGECFKYTLFLMNDVCIFGEMQGQDANDALLKLLSGDVQILRLAENCYWTVVVFSLAHEVAHVYLASIGKNYSPHHPEKEEFDADMIAYHIVLKIIMDKSGSSRVLKEYTYLAPMMYMDFFDLYYYTDRVLYKSRIFDPQHPRPIDRKNRLFAIANKDEYDFNTVDGNHLYGGFLDVYDEYKEQVLLKKERGKLESIIHTERRKLMRRNWNDETGSIGV